jgi:hypothetical protein
MPRKKHDTPRPYIPLEDLHPEVHEFREQVEEIRNGTSALLERLQRHHSDYQPIEMVEKRFEVRR